MVEQDKPFKTIEVVDASTGELCKVACMSCIRGHRTTSCGIPVCRSKVFWTVKRPGRPSNSCTCRYGGTGRCKCAMVKSACPHKAKKGEKRSGECRCDEQGRYCCLISPEQWIELLALAKPVITFFASREALEARNQPQSLPTQSGYPSPSPGNLLHSLPTSPLSVNDRHMVPHNLVPRFGQMGVGTAYAEAYTPSDMHSWSSPPSIAPSFSLSQAQNNPIQHQQQPFGQGHVAPPMHPETPASYVSPADVSNGTLHSQVTSFDTDFHSTSVGTHSPAVPAFDFDKMTADYFHYQLPNAICQKCGLNGCTCKHCPPVMQNFATGSWAQCCGRKHARTATTATSPSMPQSSTPSIGSSLGATTFTGYSSENVFDHSTTDLSSNQPSTFGDFELRNDFGNDVTMAELSQPMELSDLLLSELDMPTGGCGCRGP